jgi:hypothetical protein
MRPRKRRKSRGGNTVQITIPETVLQSVNEMSKHRKEVGGGFILDDRNVVCNVNFFLSTEASRVYFDEKYPVEFHVHPITSRKKVDIMMARIPSASDIASTMTTQKEEIVFTNGYNFKIEIYDKDLFDNYKKSILRMYPPVDGKRRDEYELFNVYRNYLTDIFNDIWEDTSGTKIYEKRIERFIGKWKSFLKDAGIRIIRVTGGKVVMNVF